METIYLIIFFSSNNSMDYMDLAYSLLIVIVIPFVLAQITKLILNNDLEEKLSDFFSNYQIVFFLALAVFVIFNSEGNLVTVKNLTGLV